MFPLKFLLSFIAYDGVERLETGEKIERERERERTSI